MVEVMNDFEQVDALKRWWKSNGKSIILGIVLAVVIVVGWQYYQRHQAAKSYQASTLYQNMLVSDFEKHPQKFLAQAQTLVKEFPKTPYASLAQLFVAQHQVNQKQYSKAADALQWVVKHGSFDAIQAIAKVRLARIYINQNEAPLAVKLLKPVPKGFEGQFYLTLGDAYAKLNQWSKSQQAYQQVLSHTQARGQLRQLVEMKLSNMPQVAVTKTKGAV